MKSRLMLIIIANAMVMVFPMSVLAADYSSYSTEKLAKMSGTMASSTEEERQSFRSEWQQRVTPMSVDDRQQYFGKPANASGNVQEFRHGSSSDVGSGSQDHRGNRKRNGRSGGRQVK